MKKIIIALVIVAGLVSCNYNYSVDEDGKGVKLMKMTVKSPLTEVQIEISGEVKFNEQGTDITYISPGGFLKYYEDGKELEAVSDNGKATIKIYDGGEEISADSEQGRQLLAQAIEHAKKLLNKH
ncbi:MAG TPA: hypothetical protein VEA37_04325 [Flavobacterium sp.]|nr:hypothetical protein [Flavobacterium sp.]